MTVNRPERRPISRAEEIAAAEARDLPTRVDGADRREPIAAREAIAADIRRNPGAYMGPR